MGEGLREGVKRMGGDQRRRAIGKQPPVKRRGVAMQNGDRAMMLVAVQGSSGGLERETGSEFQVWSLSGSFPWQLQILGDS